jgi:hypothetical protein
MKGSIFLEITLCSPLKNNRSFEGKYSQAGNKREAGRKQCSTSLSNCFTLISFLAYTSTLKMEARYSPETSVEFLRTTRRYIIEDGTFFIMFAIANIEVGNML